MPKPHEWERHLQMSSFVFWYERGYIEQWRREKMSGEGQRLHTLARFFQSEKR